ncbi:sensor histidine kinase [Streptosporangium saharense]|uniref:histidine kinase n=1 Tax=Streptosporangium saharense TaxID=1706840 RepID=A0A7W7QJP7_9ACTN|nr:histidine kinase [Streptosporangium saharense]MBB4914321.1 signal transduction histidine kinase [Streptosporangium saharense]
MDVTTALAEAERRIGALDLRRIIASPLADVAVGVVLAFFALAQLNDRSALTLLAAMLATLPHALRRKHPWLVVALVSCGALCLLYTGMLPNNPLLAVLLSGALTLYTIACRLGPLRAGLAVGAVTVLLLAVAFLLGGPRSLWSLTNDGRLLILFLGTVTVLFLAHVRRSSGTIREMRADNLETLREQAAMAERARIAREMHDIVAHSVSKIAVQAETAPYTLDGLDERTRQEFAEIATSARTTLTEMRRLLGVLRADVVAAPETAPQPGLARLPELLERHGGEVDLDVVGEAFPVPQAVDISAYRIIQEALTNARVHAPGARVSIELAYRPALLALRITDNGPGPSGEIGDTGDGHGLVGMRERALALGGWFTAGPGPSGGFLIQVGLPLE